MTTPWINFLTMLPDTVLTVTVVYLLLGAKKPLLYFSVHLFAILAFAVFKVFFSSLPLANSTIISLAVMLVPPLVLCKGIFVRRLFYVTLVTVAMFLSDYLGILAFMVFHKGVQYAPNAMPISAMVTMRLTYTFFFLVFNSIIFALKPAELDKTKTKIIRKFYLFPLSQLFILAVLIACTDFSNADKAVIVFGVVSVLVCIAANIALFLAIRELNKKQELEFEATALQNQLNTQISYYDRLVSDMDKLNQMRHDFKNQMQAAYALIENQDSDTARAQLNALSSVMENWQSNKYGNNPVVNAVLSDKARICDENHILFFAHSDLPEDLHIEGIVLCSVFSNLMDNAINACCKLPDKNERSIELSASLRSGFLIVKVKNTAIETAIKPSPGAEAGLPEHGVGLKILRNISETHNGRIELNQNEDSFEVTLWLGLEV